MVIISYILYKNALKSFLRQKKLQIWEYIHIVICISPIIWKYAPFWFGYYSYILWIIWVLNWEENVLCEERHISPLLDHPFFSIFSILIDHLLNFIFIFNFHLSSCILHLRFVLRVIKEEEFYCTSTNLNDDSKVEVL
jgi:hypothetical protein